MAKQLVRNEDEVISSDEEHEVEPKLADVPFGELQKLRLDGTVVFVSRIKSEKTTGRANKNRPMEASSKKPIGRFREVFQVPKKGGFIGVKDDNVNLIEQFFDLEWKAHCVITGTIRDPRFEPLCGKLDDDGFKKRFNFLFDKNLPAEKEDLQKKLKSSKNPKVSEELKDRIAWIDKQLNSDVSKSAEDQILAEHKKREREAAKQGKRPFYLKKSEVRKQKLIEKYERLKAAGKVDSYIDKRRRRNAAKDHRNCACPAFLFAVRRALLAWRAFYCDRLGAFCYRYAARKIQQLEQDYLRGEARDGQGLRGAELQLDLQGRENKG
ncbi:Ribosomal RNA processing protein 36-like protein [Drosera capensis]